MGVLPLGDLSALAGDLEGDSFLAGDFLEDELLGDLI